MKNLIKSMVVITFCGTSAGCATKVVKSPCGPSASLMNPCDDRTPINKDKNTSLVFGASLGAKKV